MWKCEIHEIRVKAMFWKFPFLLSCKSRQNISLYIVSRVYAWVGTNRTEQPIFQQLSRSLKSSSNSRPKPTIRFQSLSNHINFHITALTHCTELQGMPYTKVHFTPHAFHMHFSLSNLYLLVLLWLICKWNSRIRNELSWGKKASSDSFLPNISGYLVAFKSL